MDVNARINWQAGMELTAETFRGSDERAEAKHRLALGLLAFDGNVGVVPGSEFVNDGCFVRNTFEMERFRCRALLPNGGIVDADERVSLTIPMLYGDTYYLTVGLSDEAVDFECEGVGYARPRYSYALHTLDEIAEANVLPVVRFNVSGGVFSIDSDYIEPRLKAATDKRVVAYLKGYAETMQAISSHANLADGDGKQLLYRYLFRLNNLRNDIPTTRLLDLLQDTASAVDHFVFAVNGEHQEQPRPSLMDIRVYLEWLSSYLKAAVALLDKVVLEDNSIDYDKLKAEIKAEIYERLNPELYERLINDLKTNLRTELSESLTAALTDYFSTKLRPEIHDALSDELRQQLSDSLYTSLYDALYKALYIPEEEEEEFLPTI